MINIHSISVSAVCDTAHPFTTAQGDSLYQKIRESLEKEQPIAISFKGIESMTATFLFSFIGQLHRDFDPVIGIISGQIIPARPCDVFIMDTTLEFRRMIARVIFDSKNFHKKTREVSENDIYV